MKERGFRYNGEITRLKAGDAMTYDAAVKAVSFSRSTNPPSPDDRLHMDGDDKFLFCCIQNEEDFFELATLIAALSGLRCVTVETSPRSDSRWSATFAE